jgi:hypothetical protein
VPSKAWGVFFVSGGGGWRGGRGERTEKNQRKMMVNKKPNGKKETEEKEKNVLLPLAKTSP